MDRLSMRQAITRLIDRWIPMELHTNQDQLLRARVLCAVSGALVLMIGVVAALLTTAVPLNAGAQELAALVLGGVTIALLASLGLVRFTNSLALSSHGICFVVFAIFTLVNCAQGGLDSPSLCLLITIPVLAAVMLGRGAGIFWGGVVIANWIAFLLIHGFGLTLPRVLSEQQTPAVLVLDLAITCVTIVSAVVVYEMVNSSLRDLLAAEREKFEHLADHDLLTELHNRRGFYNQLDQAVRRASRSIHRTALLVIDLNDFKPINDRFGHGSGDAVLRIVAERMREVVRTTDHVGRLGGDEFGIVLEPLSLPIGAEVVAEKLAEAIALPIIVGGEELSVSASIGIALYPDHSHKAGWLLDLADRAMYEAKSAGAVWALAIDKPGGSA
jgi:diguanylate cyclase (GGDEF)-like protein